MKDCSKPLPQSCGQQVLNLLGICRKAAKLILGFDPVKEAAAAGQASLILLAEDASPKTKKEAGFLCKDGLPLAQTALLMGDLERLFHRKVAVMAICDPGFARRFQELLAQQPASADTPNSADL